MVRGFADGWIPYFSLYCVVCGIMATCFEVKEVDAMSIIMAYKTEDKIYLGADNRAVTLEETISSDDKNKIIVINNDVAVAFAGCNKTQMMFEMLISKSKNKEDLKVEDALKYIRKVYKICKIFWFKKFAKEILNIGSRIIVAGKNKKDVCCVYTVSILHGKFEKPSLTNRFMFPPYDSDIKICFDIYALNLIKYPNDFISRTIKDIAKISKLISPSGDIWTYDMISGKCNLEHFS